MISAGRALRQRTFVHESSRLEVKTKNSNSERGSEKLLLSTNNANIKPLLRVI